MLQPSRLASILELYDDSIHINFQDHLLFVVVAVAAVLVVPPTKLASWTHLVLYHGPYHQLAALDCPVFAILDVLVPIALEVYAVVPRLVWFPFPAVVVLGSELVDPSIGANHWERTDRTDR